MTALEKKLQEALYSLWRASLSMQAALPSNTEGLESVERLEIFKNSAVAHLKAIDNSRKLLTEIRKNEMESVQ